MRSWRSVPQTSQDSENQSKQPAPRLEGLSSKGYRIVIAAARFNDHIVSRLVEGAVDALIRLGTLREEIQIVRVPGAFELPLAARELARSGQYDAIIALGCVIRGETPHFEHISRVAADGLERVSLDYGLPVGFGLLTTNTSEEAIARAGGQHGNTGSNAAVAAVEMACLLKASERR